MAGWWTLVWPVEAIFWVSIWVLLVQYFVTANRRTEHQKVDTDLITRIYFGCLNACIRRLKRLWGVCSGEGQMKQALIAEDCDQEVKNFWVTKSALRSSRCVHDQSSRNCLLFSISLDTTTEYQNRFRLKMHWNDHTAHHHTKSSNQSLWLGRVCEITQNLCPVVTIADLSLIYFGRQEFGGKIRRNSTLEAYVPYHLRRTSRRMDHTAHADPTSSTRQFF